MRTLIIGLASTITVVSCTSHDVIVGTLQDVTTLKAIPNRELDVLFVIDNSPSMAEEQASLARNFPRMIDVLQTLDDGLPDLHIGVITSDMGTSGASGTAPAAPIGNGPGACQSFGDNGRLVPGAQVTDRFISDVSDGHGGRTVNYSGALRDAFASVALVGDQGCGFEQHLHAMRTALDNNPLNAGFLRPEANLAVVILADEDDCSASDPTFFDPSGSTLGPLQSFRCFRFGVQCLPDDPTNPGVKSGCAPRVPATYISDVQPFTDFLITLKGDPRKVMVAGIVGDPAPVAVALASPPGGGSPIPVLQASCVFTGTNGTQTADPGVRIATFLDGFPGRSKRTSICDPDLTGALAEIGHSTKQLVGDPCLDTTNLADSSSAPGIQPACEVVDIRDSAPDAPTSLPPCVAGATDCFEIVNDAAACPATADHTRVRMHRAAAVSDDTWTHVRCQLANP
ncbi:MAG: hypothetical protein JWO36_4217 [Myxococcales bacterium]|nr:hypothetical protein [Myxococcales bacterium]